MENEIKKDPEDVVLRFKKGTLKYSCKDYVVYKKDYFREHYAQEVNVLTGHKISAELRQQEDEINFYFDEDGVAHKYDDTYDIIIHCDDENHQEKLIKLIRKSCVKRKVNYSFDGYYNGDPVVDMAECPNCEHEFEFDTPEWEANYCPACGQALDWEVEEAPEDE